ncbi:hypothetical protein AWW72_13340 [Acinetobacter sp. NRRL B-65365]|uniref:hypothetical protein n=1 Tax=Acinetobacter sp. NRRL B-65365 TaxID=1785092 RepID=UPI0007A09083|nr:hypothetical protein [Acinetobacter sp. NRRL B-65365]KYQ83567.1 hypothetical protein AWW72_13340 [Acinetobacter sp. NRRL B-65365]
MKQQCIQAVAQALGKTTLNQQEIQNIEQRVIDAKKNIARKDRQRWHNLSDTEKLKEASQQVALDIQSQLQRKKQIAVNDAITQSKNIAALDHPTLPASEVVDRMVAAHGDMSGIQSIDSKARAIASIYRGDLVDFYTNIKGGIGVFTDQNLVKNIIQERFGQSSGDALAKHISDKMGDVFENMRDRFNRNGGDIGKLDDWGMPQTHNSEKLAVAGKEQWMDDAIQNIDHSKYVHEDGSIYSMDELKELLSYAFDSIIMDGANKIQVGKATPRGTSKVTSKHSESRVLHFKDADAWMDYQSKYGGMQFVDLIEAHVSSMSKDIALVEALGSNPKTAMKVLMDAAKAKDSMSGGTDLERKKNSEKADATLKRAQVMFDELTGGNAPQSQVLANLGLAYRSMNVASMLGGTTLSSVTDQAMIAKTASVHNIAYRKTFGELITQLNPANKADRELAHSLGLATEEMLGTINRWADDGLTSVYGKSEKLAKISNGVASQVMRVSFLNALTAASKVGFSKMLMAKYGDMTRSRAWSDLTDIDKELLTKTGLSERAWEVMRLADPVLDRKGNKLMSARSIYEIPDSKLSQFGDPKRVREEVATQLQTHLLDEQGMAVIEGGLRERTWMTGGLKRGTAMGEILRCTLQFKTFPSAFLMRQGSRTLAQNGLKGKAEYGMSLFFMTTLLGALVVQLKELANGNDPQTMWDSDDPQKTTQFFSRSVVQGGGLSVLGDIVAAGVDPSGRGVSDFIAGPAGGDAKTVLGLTLGNLNQWYEGKDTNAANEAFKLAKSKIPAQNLWYTKAAVNRMFFDEIQDSIAPGYRQKLLRKAQREQGRSRWWGDDIADIQAPDFERVIQ